MSEQAKPFKQVQNRLDMLGSPAIAPDTAQEKKAAATRPKEAYLANETSQADRRSVLDTLLASGRINWEVVIWLAIIALAIFTRLYDLAPRAMHHDESIHGKFSYDMYKGISVYRYDPTWHGPVLYYMVTLSYFLLGGASEFSARFAPAVFSIGMIAICWFLRPLIGRIGAIAFAILMLISPSILYYGRSLRHDMFATFGMLLFVIGWFRFAQERPGRKIWWMGVSGIGFFILFGSHEMSFLNLGMVLGWLGLCFLFEIIALPSRFRRHTAAELESKPAKTVKEYKEKNKKAPATVINADDDELDSPIIAESIPAATAEAETVAGVKEEEIRAEVSEPATVVKREPITDRATPYHDPILGKFKVVYPALLGLFAFLVVTGAIHLITDKYYDGDIQKLFGQPAWLLLIPFYLLLSAAIAYPLAKFINFGYNRLSPRSNLIGRGTAGAVFVLLAAVAALLFMRGKSPVNYLMALNMQAAGNPSTASSQLISQGFTGYSEFSYVALSWPSILPQLGAIIIVALFAGMLAGWLIERRLLVYTEKGIYGFGISTFFVLLLASLVSLRFVLVPDRNAMPKAVLPLLGTVDKWFAYVLGGAVLALIIGVVAGWFVSLGEKLSDEDMRGSAIFRAILRFAREPKAVVALLAGFGILYVLIFSNFFFAPERLADGFFRGIEYWLEQHDKRRLDQPWFYYPMLMLLYETFAVVFMFIALVYFPITFWRRTNKRGRFIFTARGIFIGLTFWWSFVSLVMYSIAGEKIPWLNMQIAMPFSLAAAAFLNDYIKGVNWKRVFAPKEGLLFGGLFLGMFAATLALVGMVINFPKKDVFNAGFNRAATSMDLNMATLQAILVGGIIVILFAFALWLWWSNRLSGKVARAVVMVCLGSVLLFYCVKSTIALNYDHPDVAVEPMIYTQTSPEVPLFVERLGRLSRDLRDVYKVTPAPASGDALPAIYPDPSNSKGLPVYVSTEVAWPLSWYLREYTNVCWCAVNGDANANPIDKLTDSRGNNYAVIMVSSGENTSKMQQLLQGQYTSQQYRFRWHFPEDDSGYGGLGYVPSWDTREYRIAVKDIVNTRWDMFVRSFTEQPFAGRLWRYLAYRELWQPLQSFDMVVYVRNDIYPDFALTPGAGNAPVANPDSLPAYDLTTSNQPGNRNGQYRTPRNVAIAPGGDILVLDSLNGRVQRFDKDGKFLSKFGAIGTGDGQFTLAAYDSGPGGITVDEEGNIYVTDTWGYRIQKFDKDGRFLLKFGSGGQDTKGEAALNAQFPTYFYGPRSIAYNGKTGELFITDTGNRRIVVYDKQGNFKRQFGIKGSGPGQFDEPVSVAIGPDGNLYVNDMRNKRVQVVDLQGNFVKQIAIPSWKEAQLSEPYLTFDMTGNLYVSDPANGAILRFDQNGNQLNTYNLESGQALVNPVGLAVDSQGFLIVADAKRNAITRFKP